LAIAYSLAVAVTGGRNVDVVAATRSVSQEFENISAGNIAVKEKTMKRRIGFMIAAVSIGLLIGIPLLHAQQPAPPAMPQSPSRPSVPPRAPVPPQPPMDPLGDVMFPPEMIMGHARELGITDDQKIFMRGEIQKTTTRFLELQWQLQDAMEALHQTMKGNTVDEQQALSQLEKVLDTERQIKRLHFGLGIRLKNQLTAEQQEKLRGMRMAPRPEGRPGPDGPPRPDAAPRPGEELQ
jgi:Spy/CpxP family protein refolding chaperone